MATVETDVPKAGNPGNWPTAGAIDHVISLAEAANGRTSPLHGMGSKFIEFGYQYGINPGFVAATLQKESQMGCDGSILPTRCNNFGGNTWAASTGYPECTVARGVGGHVWIKYPTALAGLEGVFKNLNQPIYRNTGGRLADVLEVYSPSFENNVSNMMFTIQTVASQMGITLDENTNIYSNSGVTGTTFGLENHFGDNIKFISDWALGGLREGLLRITLVTIGLGILFVATRKVL